jgi:predicted transcriptional regulator
MYKPTESELEILSILWEKGNETVKEVHEQIQQIKKVGYTTTLKLMQIMNEKGLVTRNITNKKHIYTSALKKEKVQDQFIHKLLLTLFGGSWKELIQVAFEKNALSQKELVEIKLMIEKLQIN